MDRLSADRRSALMRRVRRADTAPEMVVRRLVYGMGYRYRLHARDLPGRPDMVFRGRRAVIFVHGCFWHGHSCLRGRPPASNVDFWAAKLKRNAERDQRVISELRKSGWRVLVIWECELKAGDDLQRTIRRFLEQGDEL
ncbi:MULTISPECIES: very short patch repair endonuclease [Burkholderia]|jgi:DNA mismatch endonuclease (patch repair protein)|uniref:very short patch repair endonuclease n=1 Tax=Burkholderia TaxID=32008 RepID=UPI001BA1D409|nr:very short patch repair endonuclease [Burkholderia multivorans]MBR8048670.1 DNA mismatch endonuclease Vsr [Burkholderia multivorans]MCA8225480.1 very short patch repair endonuclease [Burkholderia multivorans]